MLKDIIFQLITKDRYNDNDLRKFCFENKICSKKEAAQVIDELIKTGKVIEIDQLGTKLKRDLILKAY